MPKGIYTYPSRVYWTEEELSLLEEMVGVYPFRVVVEKLNEWHEKRNSKAKRTIPSVRKRINQMGLSPVATEDNMTACMWARVLGIKEPRVCRWKYAGLKSKRIAHNQSMISIHDMKEFAMQKPHFFADINPEILEYYFGENLTSFILSNTVVSSKKIKVKDMATGKIYESLRETSRNVFLATCSICREIKKPNGRFQRVK